jgi:carboxyl-terminal processing protease
MRPSTFLLLLSLVVLIGAFIFVTRGAGAADPRGSYWNEDVERFVRGRVAATYVDELDDEAQRDAFYRAMNGYLDLDPYSEFLPPREQKHIREDIEGRYAGLGIKIEAVDEGLALVGVFPGGPADQAGLKVGDTLVRADEASLANIEIEDVTLLLKGKPNTTVRVAYLPGPRPESGPPDVAEREIVVTRGVIRPPTVFSRYLGDRDRFVHIRLTDFAEETEADFNGALDAARDKGVDGVILDLRGNGGGVLGTALQVADRFLDKGLILRMEGRARDTNKNHRARADKDDVKDLALIVLVDGTSASASEVVAGALQDHRRAVLVGERTYGKFLVQQITPIPGTRASIKLTTSRYYTPAGRSYQARSRDRDAEPAGLFPDVVVPLTEDEEKELVRFWIDEEGAVWRAEPRFPEIARDHVDPQLARAIKLLSGDVAWRAIQRGRPRNG